MRVPGLIYANLAMIELMKAEQAAEQVANVAFLPGIVRSSMAMPDIHWGYGFPIGGVAAMRTSDGVISPGGVGFDINCGVRMLRTNLSADDIKPKLKELVDSIYRNVPSGVGSEGRIRLHGSDINDVLLRGSAWAVKNGYGDPADLETTEEHGEMSGVDPNKISKHAKERGSPQLGTLGSGNHFLEIAAVDEIYEPAIAKDLGINRTGQVMLWIHCGSRGLGHQVAEDYIKIMLDAMVKYKISVPDRQLACAPVDSPEGSAYLSAMRGAANFAWANRQCISHWVRESFCEVLDITQAEAGLELVYDVCHNVAKIENYEVDGKRTELCVHRKGATRAFPAGHPDLPSRYKNSGQPVLIPGDMGRFSYILVGTEAALRETFGSTCHGAGRLKSRSAAKKMLRGSEVLQRLASLGYRRACRQHRRSRRRSLGSL